MYPTNEIVSSMNASHLPCQSLTQLNNMVALSINNKTSSENTKKKKKWVETHGTEKFIQFIYLIIKF